MAKQSVVIAAALAVGLVLWSALSGESYPLVILAAGALVTTLVVLGPSSSRPDPRDPQDAAEDIARRSRHTEGR